jgi:hypothetical protein
MGHVGWFQEYWILRHLDGAKSLLAGSDGIYDAFNVSYTRWEMAATLEVATGRKRRFPGATVLPRRSARISTTVPAERSTSGRGPTAIALSPAVR